LVRLVFTTPGARRRFLSGALLAPAAAAAATFRAAFRLALPSFFAATLVAAVALAFAGGLGAAGFTVDAAATATAAALARRACRTFLLAGGSLAVRPGCGIGGCCRRPCLRRGRICRLRCRRL